jgi:hypothetical protein
MQATEAALVAHGIGFLPPVQGLSVGLQSHPESSSHANLTSGVEQVCRDGCAVISAREGSKQRAMLDAHYGCTRPQSVLNCRCDGIDVDFPPSSVPLRLA